MSAAAAAYSSSNAIDAAADLHFPVDEGGTVGGGGGTKYVNVFFEERVNMCWRARVRH